MNYVVYTTIGCPKCEELKKVLRSRGIEFEVKDMSAPAAITELRVNGVFTLSAPVLSVGDKFYTVEELAKMGFLS
jgi:glutaredoxin